LAFGKPLVYVLLFCWNLNLLLLPLLAFMGCWYGLWNVTFRTFCCCWVLACRTGQQPDILACMAFAMMYAWAAKSGCVNIINLQHICMLPSIWICMNIISSQHYQFAMNIISSLKLVVWMLSVCNEY
jgi:hypothetical protein